MLQWNSRATSRSWGQSKFSQDHCACTGAFQLFLAELCPSDTILVAATGVCLAGVHSVTWLKNRTAPVRSSTWRRRTPRKFLYDYCHPSCPDQSTYKFSQLVRRRTLRGMHLVAPKKYTAAKAKKRNRKAKERCRLKELLRSIWSRGRLVEGEVEKTFVTVWTSHIRPAKGLRERCKWYGGKRYSFLPLDLLFFSSFLCPFFFSFFFPIDCSMDVMSQM